MRVACGSLEFAHARLHARHGERVDEAGWRGIEMLRGLAPLLERARGTALRPWLVGITAESSPAQIESALRAHWQALVDEVEAWMPALWQPAVAWCAVLPDLAPLQHLARGEPPPRWMTEDARWQALCRTEAPARPGALAHGPWAALAPAFSAPRGLGEAWLAEWRRRLPSSGDAGGDAGRALAELARVALDHQGAFAVAAPDRGWLLRSALRARLALLLRRAGLGPAAVFVHLALCALDLERLRAELLRRTLFPHWKLA
jgi:hypothetical protein